MNNEVKRSERAVSKQAQAEIFADALWQERHSDLKARLERIKESGDKDAEYRARLVYANFYRSTTGIPPVLADQKLAAIKSKYADADSVMKEYET